MLRGRRLLALLILLAAAWAAQASDWGAVAFSYHRFAEDAYPSTNVTLEQFEAHLEHLEAGGYNVWPLEKIARHVADDKAIPDRTVAITMDNAYRSVYEVAYPLLRERGWPFTVFVATDPVDGGYPGFMTWDQMREMAQNGGRFANHGATQENLLRLWTRYSGTLALRVVEQDILHANARLEEELGADVVDRLFAYPYGEYSAELAERVRELGYVGVGQQSGAIGPNSDLRSLPRFPMSEAFAGPEDFALRAATRALPIHDIDPWDPVVDGENPPRLWIRLENSMTDPEKLNCFVSGMGEAEVIWDDKAGGVFSIRAREKLDVGHSRYTCTLPAGESGRYYWLGQQWFVLPGD